MDELQALILGILQGAAEFLPISSSGHLVLVPWWLGWDSPPLIYDVAVHVGTATAVIVYFWRDWLRLFQASFAALQQRTIKTADEKMLLFLALATIPAAIAGLLLEDFFDDAFSDPALVALMLLVTAALLTFSERTTNTTRTLQSIRLPDAIAIGFAQALAIMPGISRSGSTIAMGLIRDFTREDAARFSFLLATPIILAAGAKQTLDVILGAEEVDAALANALVIGFISSLITGYLCIAFLLRFVRQRRLYGFAVYCAAFGVVSFVAALLRG